MCKGDMEQTIRLIIKASVFSGLKRFGTFELF